MIFPHTDSSVTDVAIIKCTSKAKPWLQNTELGTLCMTMIISFTGKKNINCSQNIFTLI